MHALTIPCGQEEIESSRGVFGILGREKIDAQVFPWNNGGIVIKDEEEEWKLKRYMKYEIQDWMEVKIYFKRVQCGKRG